MTQITARIVRERQPVGIPAIDWDSPFARGLVFLAWPVGQTFVDLVTGVVGTRTGTTGARARASNDGKSRRGDGYAVHSAGGLNDYVVWPVSSRSRGGDLVNIGTLLALAGTIEQVDGKQYAIGGNTEAVSVGDGCSLGIDSYSDTGRGNILRARYNNSIGHSSALLGNPFNDKTHFFGYSFAGNGATGTWFGARTGETWSGGNTFGTTTSDRRAYVNAYSSGDAGHVYGAAYVLWFGMWAREMSLVEYLALYDNPWQFFAPAERAIWVPAAVVGGGFQAAWASQANAVVSQGGVSYAP